MAQYTLMPLLISQLLLDLENPRHDILKDQNDALREMIDDQREKLINLAEDIANNGINPSELLIVIPHDDEEEKYISLEGNRRVAALKLLQDPSLAKSSNNPSLENQLKELSKSFLEKGIDTVQCVVFDDREDANRWIHIRHTGENNGIGIVRWDADAVARFNERFIGKPSVARQIIAFAREHMDLDDGVRNKLSLVRLSTLKRIIDDKDVRQALGLNIQDDILGTNLTKQEVSKGLKRIIKDLAMRRINVNDVRHKPDRAEYLATFTLDELPDLSNQIAESWKLVAPPASENPSSSNQTGNNQASANQSTSDDQTKARRSAPDTTNRKYLIPSNCILKITDQRINTIYRELKGLEVDRFTNAAAVTLRVFLELSLDHYISTKSIIVPKGAELHIKLSKIAEFMETNNILTRNQLKAIRTAASTQDAIFSTNTFNAYVHNRYFTPRPLELKITWNNFQNFIVKLWE